MNSLDGLMVVGLTGQTGAGKTTVCEFFKNKGFATETLSACIDLIFQSGFKTVKAGAFEENFASQRVMQKCGMTLTGEEEQIEYRGEIHRCVYYQKRQT